MSKEVFLFPNKRSGWFLPKTNYQGPMGFKKKAWKRDEALAILDAGKDEFDEEKLMKTSVHASKFWFRPISEKCPKFNVDQLTLHYDKDGGQVEINFCLGDYGYDAGVSLDTTDHEELKALGEALINIAKEEKRSFKHEIRETSMFESDDESLQRHWKTPKEEIFVEQFED